MERLGQLNLDQVKDAYRSMAVRSQRTPARPRQW
jgi:hypothetical protein